MPQMPDNKALHRSGGQRGFVNLKVVRRRPVNLVVMQQTGTAMKTPIVFVLLALQFLAAQTPSVPGDFASITNSKDYRRFFRSLFANSADIELLALHENDSIAVQAMWERVDRTLPVDPGDESFRPNPERMSEFLGFLRGRLRVNPPSWWAKDLRDATGSNQDGVYYGSAYPYRRSGVKKISCPKGAVVTEGQDGVTYKNANGVVKIPNSVFSKFNGGWDCGVSCTFSDGMAFVAVHDNIGYPHSVACINVASETILWQSEACGCCWSSARGVFFSAVELVPASGGRVFVFGAASLGFYCHGFDNKGSTLAVFSTNF